MAEIRFNHSVSLEKGILLGGAILFVLTFFVPFWNKVNLLGYFVFLFLISLKSVFWGFSLVAFFLLWVGLIRWDDQANLLPSVFDSVSIIVLALGCVISVFLKNETRLGFFSLGGKGLFCLICVVFFLSFNLVVFFDVVLRSDSGLVFLLKVREYLIPQLFFFVALFVFVRFRYSISFYIKLLTLSGGFVAFFNMLHYFVGLPLFVPRYVPIHGAEDAYVARQIFGFSIYRMHHIFGLSTQGAGGAIYMGIFLNSIILFFSEEKNKITWFAVSVLSISCAVLIVSFSAILVACLFFVSVVVSCFLYKPRVFFLLFPVMILFLWGGVFLNIISAHEDLSLFRYVYSFADNKILNDVFLFFNNGPVVIGEGLGLKSGGFIGLADLPNAERHDQLFDQWFFVVLYQLGFFALLQVAIFCFILFFILIVLTRPNGLQRRNAYCFLVLFLVCISFVHGAAPIERLFSPLFSSVLAFCVASVIFSRDSYGKGEK